MGSSKDARRQEIAESLICEVSVVPPSRLLALLGQAMKYQHAQGLLPPGIPFDLFRGSRKAVKKDLEEKVPKKQAGALLLSKDSAAESILFSPDGQTLITGSIDGFIEAWDFESQKLRQDLEYQARGEFLMHEGAVQCCTFSRDNDHLATGSQSGQIKIWKLSSGLCLRKFHQAHPAGITSVSFARDGTQVLSTSYDQTARIHGLKSGKTLKEFR
jgi:WD40 repeat-containing protein SMU1